jgi:hypothetical protein
VTTVHSNDTYQVAATFTASGGAKTVTNVGLMDASTAGAAYYLQDFTPIALGASGTIGFTLSVQYL